MDSIKTLTVFAGVNGAGKSTLFYSEKSGDLGIRLNSDEIIRSNSLIGKIQLRIGGYSIKEY